MTQIDSQCEFGGVQIQPDLNSVVRDGETKKVSPRVMDVLMYLITHSDRVVPADELLSEFWPGRIVEESTVHRLISQIRSALGDSASEQRFIKTISKRGYQAVASIEFGHAPPKITEQVALPEVTQEQGEQFVFICYSHLDSRSVYPEIEWLTEQNIKVWYDRGISAGSNWRSAIGDSLLAATHVVYFVSENSLASTHCNNEVNLAIDEGVPVIPVFLEQVELTSDLKVGLNRIQHLSYTDADYRSALYQGVTGTQTSPVQDAPKSKPAPAKTKRPAVFLVSMLVVAVISAGLYFELQGNDHRPLVSEHAAHAHLETIAVMPFLNLSGDPSLDFFGQGLTDVMLDRLSQSDILNVTSRTSAFKIASEDLGVETIAERLKVAYVVEGSVQVHGDEVRITVQLIRGSDGFHVWSKTYDREFSDPFKVQEEIGLTAAVMAEAKLYNDAPRQAPDLYDDFKGIDHRAVNYYLDAVNVNNDVAMGEPGDNTFAMQLVESAIAIDPDFAAAHWDIAWHYMIRTDPTIPVAEASKRSHASLQQARRLDPENSTIEFQLIQVYKDLDLNYAEAERLILEAMVEEPDGLWWSMFLAHIALREGRLEDSGRYQANALARVRDFGSDGSLILNSRAGILVIRGNYEEALRITQEALEFTADGQPAAESLLVQARALIGLGRQTEALTALEKAWLLGGTKVPSKFAPVYLLLGNETKALDILANVKPENRNRGDFVETYLLQGDLPRAFAMMREAIEDHDGSVLDRMRSPGIFDPIKEDPRFVELLQLLESKETHTARYLTAQETDA